MNWTYTAAAFSGLLAICIFIAFGVIIAVDLGVLK